MTQQDRTWVVGLVFAVLLVLIAIAGIGREPKTPLEQRADPGTTQRDARAVSAPTATLIAAGVAVSGTLLGALLGTGLGLFGDRWLRHRGEVHCQVERSAHIRGADALHVHFFNEKEVDTGLSELAVVFVFESGEEVVLGPATRDYQTSTSPRGVINLPSKTWASVSIKGRFFGRQATLLAQQELKAVEVKAKFPGGTPYHERCLELSG